MGEDKIALHNEYVEALQNIEQMTFGRANKAIADLLTVDQIDIPAVPLTNYETAAINTIDTLFINGQQKYTELESTLEKAYNGEDIGVEINFTLAISAYEKFALNQKIKIKNTILKAKDNSIQNTLVNMSNELEQTSEIIRILERVAGEGVGEVTMHEKDVTFGKPELIFSEENPKVVMAGPPAYHNRDHINAMTKNFIEMSGIEKIELPDTLTMTGMPGTGKIERVTSHTLPSIDESVLASIKSGDNQHDRIVASIAKINKAANLNGSIDHAPEDKEEKNGNGNNRI